MALRRVPVNYVALLWIEVSQPWFKRFSEGGEGLKDDPSSGQLSITSNPTTIREVHELVARDC
jgi:hypothetical protein